MADEETKQVDKGSAAEQLLIKRFRKRCEAALAKIKNPDEFRQSNTMVDYVFKVGSTMFSERLDAKTVDYMVRVGGRLSGAYVYLGQQSSFARGKRDTYLQKSEEVEKERLLEVMSRGIKVTEARAMIAEELSEVKELVIDADIEKNQWENILEACDKMISFIQSGIKVKEGERRMSGRMGDQG